MFFFLITIDSLRMLPVDLRSPIALTCEVELERFRASKNKTKALAAEDETELIKILC